MNCSSAEALFERFLEGQVGSVQRSSFAAHIDRCAGCRGVLEELRVVDALLNEPRRIELAPNFTFATMAEARALGAPVLYRTPVRAYLVSYLAAAWLLAGAALLLAPHFMHALAGTTLDIARSITNAVGGLGTVIGQSLGRGGGFLTTLLAALLALDAMLVAGFGFALKYVQPRLADRLRS
jgi:predicted anti-sigma-YlaC factor YlaD